MEAGKPGDGGDGARVRSAPQDGQRETLSNPPVAVTTANRALSVQTGARTEAEWVLITLFPFLFGWKRSMLHHHVMQVVGRTTLLARIGPFAEVALASCVLYVLMLPAARSKSPYLRVASIVACNLVAILFLADVRCRVLLLQPLTWRTLSHLTNLSMLEASAPTFLGSRFWMYGLASLAVLNLSMVLFPLAARLLDAAGQPLARNRQVVSFALVPTIPLLAAISIAAPPLTYHIESSLFTAPFLSAFQASDRHVDRSALAQCDEKSRPAGPPRIASPLSGSAAKKNVLLFIGETWSYAETGLGDRPGADMPTLRQLAAIGPIATRARTQVAYSTRAIYGILTGRYASPSEELVEGTTPSFGALASILKEAGYSTSFFSSQNLDWDNTREQYRSMGFDVIKDARTLVKDAKARGEDPFNNSLGADDALLLDGLLPSIPRDRPFFSVFYNWATHTPYACLKSGSVKKGTSDDVASFRCALHESDAVLGQLVEQLRARGQLESTIIVVVGDHGENFADGHTSGRGCSMTEVELNAPLVIAVPGLTPDLRGRLAITSARQIDIVPTVVDLLGLASPAPVQGESLLAARRERAPETSYFNSFGEGSVAGLVEGASGSTKKYTQNLETGDVWAADLTADPLGVVRTPLTSSDRSRVVGRLAACSQYDDAQARGEPVPFE